MATDGIAPERKLKSRAEVMELVIDTIRELMNQVTETTITMHTNLAGSRREDLGLKSGEIAQLARQIGEKIRRSFPAQVVNCWVTVEDVINATQSVLNI